MNFTPTTWTLLDAGHVESVDLAFVGLLALAGVGSVVLLGLALAALVRRPSRSYLLVTLALATLLARTAVAVLTLTSSVAAGPHHLLEHALDAVMASLVVAAVYDARSARQSAADDSPPIRSDGGSEPVESERVPSRESATARERGSADERGRESAHGAHERGRDDLREGER
ncbi:DUF7471 family protein [Halorussus caseinilyticus]|uniref:Histidine kinase n=1 Tax=Halorussus caseinilyticus TaxID=3034025 RepID=A0ABD5WEK9_9EURY|nr:hypothetical protein [Halorussus sp. DT72]